MPAGHKNGARLFQTTRGRMLLLLCRGRRTVGELAVELNITKNAVRAQIQRLQRDGLIQPAGSRAGVRRPHVDYEITPKAQRLFPTAYELVLHEVLDALARELPAQTIQRLLSGVLRGLVERNVGSLQSGRPSQRAIEFVERIAPFAPGITVTASGEATVVEGCSCPLASLTASHPDLCQLVAATLSETLGTGVREICDRGQWPRCRFEIAAVK